MSSLIIAGDTSGQITIAAPAVAGSNTLTLPVITDTITTLNSTQTLANKTLTAPVFSGTATGTYTLGGTPSLAATALTGTIAAARLPAGSVLQVVSTTKTDTFVGSVNTNTFTDITGMSVSITPTSASSKILVIVFLNGGSYDGIEKAPWRLMRNSTPICIGDAAGNRGQASGDSGGQNVYWPGFNGNIFLDSPSTTSSTTYKCQYVTTSSGIFYVNRSVIDRNDSAAVDARSSSTITVMEIAA